MEQDTSKGEKRCARKGRPKTAQHQTITPKAGKALTQWFLGESVCSNFQWPTYTKDMGKISRHRRGRRKNWM